MTVSQHCPYVLSGDQDVRPPALEIQSEISHISRRPRLSYADPPSECPAPSLTSPPFRATGGCWYLGRQVTLVLSHCSTLGTYLWLTVWLCPLRLLVHFSFSLYQQVKRCDSYLFIVFNLGRIASTVLGKVVTMVVLSGKAVSEICFIL